MGTSLIEMFYCNATAGIRLPSGRGAAGRLPRRPAGFIERSIHYAIQYLYTIAASDCIRRAADELDMT
jgi:hypothetical protein